MNIWEYSDPAQEQVVKQAARSRVCIFCKTQMNQIVGDALERAHDVMENYELDKVRNLDEVRTYTLREIDHYELHSLSISVCPACGWWWMERVEQLFDPIRGEHREAASACLRSLDPTDVSLPIEEVTRYLAARYDRPFDINPRIFEEVVADVFSGLGYCARVTSYGKDNGIDIFMDGPGDKLIGVQVKRYKNSIQVDQIRELLGAMVINDCTEGVFVTTSTFQSGCESTSESSMLHGYPIELYDAEKLYDALKISRINTFDAEKIVETTVRGVEFCRLEEVDPYCIP